VNCIDARAYRSHHIGGCQTVIVVRVKIEQQPGITVVHILQAAENLLRRHDTQGIGQHEMADAAILEPVHQIIDILPAITITIGPVFQIHID